MSLSKEVKNFVDLQILLTKTTELIRKLFLVNWKKLYGQDWIETNHNAKVYFTNGGGTKAFAKMNSDQKQHAILGDTTKWDITLFYIILSQSNLIDKSNLKHLEKIKNIRNNVAHNSKMSLTDQQFETNWDELKNCLIQLGNDKQQVEDLKLNLNPQSVSNKVYDELKQKANDYFKEKEYSESIDFYTKALEVKNLTNDQLAVLYSNRSLVYLKLYEENQKDRDYLFKALIDAEQANIYNPKWSKTYARLGQVYTELNEYQKSIEYYSKALILDPINNEIKNSLARVKELNFEQERMSHFDNTYFPKTTEERSEETFEKLKDRVGEKYVKNMSDNLEEMKKNLIKIDPTLEDVWLGHEYRDGSKQFKINYELAAKYYSKAAHKGNAEGMYNLGLLHKKGLGVLLDYKLAFSLFKQAASRPAFRKLGINEIPNVGVSEAEHMLALMYHNGVYVGKNLSMAIEYYQRAIEHGSPESANNLGLLYMNGDGVQKNLDRAEQLFMLSHKKGCVDAIMNLVCLYLAKGDPDNALLWHNRDLEANSLLALAQHNSIMNRINVLKETCKKLNVPKNQSIHNILKHKIPNLTELMNQQQQVYPQSIRHESFDSKMLSKKALEGSKTAEKMLKALDLFNTGLSEFEQDSDLTLSVDKISRAFQMESIVCRIPIEMLEHLIEKLEEILSKRQHNDLDRNSRLILAHLKSADYKQNVKLMTQSIKLYPSFIPFSEIRASMYCFLRDYTNGIKDFDHVIGMEPENTICVYLKASALRNSSRYHEAIEHYEKFIEISPKDNRKIPDTYYSIGLCKLVTESKNLECIKLIRDCYHKGELAELDQLPCFLPYEATIKNRLKSFVEFPSPSDMPKGNRNEAKIELIKRHRKLIDELKYNERSKPNEYVVKSTFKPNKNQTMNSSLNGLKEIAMKQIDFTKDEILKGRFLKVRIFDVPVFGFTSVFFIVDDDENTFERLSVYNLGNDQKKISDKFRVGTWISIVNPYIRQARDGEVMIRVDDPKSIIFTGKITEKMCRYCGKENSKYNCAKCEKASYCSKECQTNDWKELNHKFICF